MEFLSHQKKRELVCKKTFAGVLEQSHYIFNKKLFNLISADTESYLIVLTKIVSLETLFFDLLALTYSKTQLRCSQSLGFGPLKFPV